MRSSSNRESFADQAGLLAFVQGKGADGGAGAGAATSVADFTVKERAQARFDERPRAHVLRFFLAPNQSGLFWKRFHRSPQLRFIQRVKLFDPDDGGIVYLFLLAISNEIEINFPAAENHALDLVGLIAAAAGDRGYRVRDDLVKFAADEVLGARGENSARNKLLGVMMMSGLMKSRFICRRRT